MGDKLKSAIEGLEKTYGKNVILKLDDKPLKVPTLSTGVANINRALGIGGYPFGRIVEIFGPESAGKSTLALHAVKEAQVKKITVAYVDTEHSLNIQYAQDLGIDIDSLLISQPNSAEEALNVVEVLVKTEEVGLIIVDSVSALVPKSEEEGEMGDQSIGKQGKLMSQAMRKLAGPVSKSKCIVIFINQLRDKIGGYGGQTTSGGHALKYYASIRIDIRKMGVKIEDKTKHIGDTTKVKIVKNKLAPPFITTEVDLVYGKGFCPVRNTINAAVEMGVVQKAGAWYSYNGSKLAQGLSKAVTLIEDNEELFKEIESKL